MGLNRPPTDNEGSRLGPLVDAFARALEDTDPKRVDKARAELLRLKCDRVAQEPASAHSLTLIDGGGEARRRFDELKRELGAVLDEIFAGETPADAVAARARGRRLHRRLMRVMKAIIASAPPKSLRLVKPDAISDS